MVDDDRIFRQSTGVWGGDLRILLGYGGGTQGLGGGRVRYLTVWLGKVEDVETKDCPVWFDSCLHHRRAKTVAETLSVTLPPFHAPSAPRGQAGVQKIFQKQANPPSAVFLKHVVPVG